MNPTTQRPTPETDDVIDHRLDGDWGDFVSANFTRKLERERDEARERAESKHGLWMSELSRVTRLEKQLAATQLYLDEAREQIASCAINTNVRLFDLVRYMRSELHQASLITDEEYSWLCNGCEMASSPQGGSPSPRRLEDYKMLACQSKRNAELQKQLEATKAYAERCKQGCINLSFAIDRIDYVCGEPNEMEVSDYALHQDEKHVVERVKKQLEGMREAIKEAHAAFDACSLNLPSAYGKLSDNADAALAKLQPFLKP